MTEPLLCKEDSSTPAAITDLFRRGAPAFSTTLSADKAGGASSASLSSATGVPTDTAIDITVGRIDSNGLKTPALKAVYKGLLSGTTVSSLTLVEGTDQLHKAGTPVEITYTAATHNDLITGITNTLNQVDGSLKTGIVGAAALASSAVTTAKLNNTAVTADKLGLTTAAASVPTGETTTSTTYADLATTTDTVTVTVGVNGLALVCLQSWCSNNTSSAQCYVSVALSGATTAAAADANGLEFQSTSANVEGQLGTSFCLTGLTPGSTTFKMKYRVQTGGAGAGTGNFKNRRIAVVPL